MTLREIEQELNSLPLAEKLQVLQMLFFSLTDSWPAIERTPGVVGGDACIVRTRIPVWALVEYRRQGWSDAQLLESFPTLRLTNLAQAWAYAATHVAEIERALREQDMRKPDVDEVFAPYRGKVVTHEPLDTPTIA